MNKLLLVFVLACAVFPGTHAAWDRLVVTFGSFTSLPITVGNATSQGYVVFSARSTTDPSCDGVRYYLNGDMSSMPIYSAQTGTLIGFSIGIRVAPSVPNQKYWDRFTDGTWVLSTYYVDPSLICAANPHPDGSPIGNQLNLKIASSTSNSTEFQQWLSSSPMPIRGASFVSLPLTPQDALAQKWQDGKCFYTMGLHYWFNTSQNMDCSDFFPVFLLYNHGVLSAYGVIVLTDVPIASPRWEHPPYRLFSLFIKPENLPLCLQKVQFNSMHIYNTNPLSDYC